jgi:hypothetical protein
MLDECCHYTPVTYFDVLTRTIANVPARAVIKFIDLESNMLERDFGHDRSAAAKEAKSVLLFRRFVHLAKRGGEMHSVGPLPPAHIEFYKETIVRLVQANELPSSAMEQFEHAFKLSRHL